jgi:gas vesicle protein
MPATTPPVTSTSSTTPPSTSSTSTSDVAKEQTRSVGEDAKEGTRHVADVAKEETKNVAGETANQARELWHQTRSQLKDQTGQQQQRVASGLRSLGDELSSMAQTSEQQGMASDLANRGADQVRRVAEYLEGRDPGSLLEEVKRFARRRPGTFLALAAGLGVVGGRLSRSMVDEQREQQGADSSRYPVTDYPVTNYPATDYPVAGTATVGGPATGTGYTAPVGTPTYPASTSAQGDPFRDEVQP